MTHPAPLELWSETVLPDWIDYNGHMNVAYYTLVFDHAVDAFYKYVGLGRDYRDRTNNSTFAVEHHITYDREVVEGDPVRCTAQLMGFDEKRIHLYHEMYHAADGYLAATCEFLSLHIDLSIRRVTPLPGEVRDKLAEILETHGQMPPPDHVGRVIKQPIPASS